MGLYYLFKNTYLFYFFKFIFFYFQREINNSRAAARARAFQPGSGHEIMTPAEIKSQTLKGMSQPGAPKIRIYFKIHSFIEQTLMSH